jgi:hypothetical protein
MGVPKYGPKWNCNPWESDQEADLGATIGYPAPNWFDIATSSQQGGTKESRGQKHGSQREPRS